MVGFNQNRSNNRIELYIQKHTCKIRINWRLPSPKSHFVASWKPEIGCVNKSSFQWTRKNVDPSVCTTCSHCNGPFRSEKRLKEEYKCQIRVSKAFVWRVRFLWNIQWICSILRAHTFFCTKIISSHWARTKPELLVAFFKNLQFQMDSNLASQ